MLSTLLQLCGTVVLSGAFSVALPAPSTASPVFYSDQSTVSLNKAETVVFLGISGDYKAVSAEELATWLSKEKNVVVVGESIRAMGDSSRRVWAIQGSDGKKLAKGLKSGLKRKGFKVTSLVATALTPLQDDARALKAAMRDVERDEKKIWTFWGGGRNQAVWAFHESKFDSKKVEGMFRKTKAKMTFFHQEFCFKSQSLASKDGQPSEATVNIETLGKAVSASMDCLKVSARDGGMVMDLYMRDMSSVLLLESDNGRRKFLCPNVQDSPVKRLQIPELNWTVTLDNRAVPFVK